MIPLWMSLKMTLVSQGVRAEEDRNDDAKRRIGDGIRTHRLCMNVRATEEKEDPFSPVYEKQLKSKMSINDNDSSSHEKWLDHESFRPPGPGSRGVRAPVWNEVMILARSSPSYRFRGEGRGFGRKGEGDGRGKMIICPNPANRRQSS